MPKARNSAGYQLGQRSAHPLYKTWKAMLARCENPQHLRYPYYGGRGIRVCDRWHDLWAFVEDMGGNKPSPKHSLDRIDPDGDYEPGNCRWLDAKRQNNNRRDNHLLTIDGRTRTLQEWCDEFGRYENTVRERMKRGWTPAEALYTPPRQPRRQTPCPAPQPQGAAS